MLTCRVVAKWRRLPVIVAGWLALEREKRMQVTDISDPLQLCPCCKFTQSLSEGLWEILMRNPRFQRISFTLHCKLSETHTGAVALPQLPKWL